MTAASNSTARKRNAQQVAVKVIVDTDELREWADRHANMGNHGVAHVLYAAARDGESLSERAIREAVQAERERWLGALGVRERDSQRPLGWGSEMTAAMLLDAADRLANPRHRGNQLSWPRHAQMFRALASLVRGAGS